MKTRNHTTIVLEKSSYIYSSRYQEKQIANLVLSGNTETISIQFLPQHIEVLEDLIAHLRAIDSQQQMERLAKLNQEVNELQHKMQIVTTINGNGNSPVECAEF
jgi:hypothetical protein